MNIRIESPAEIFSPGEILKDELDARGWSQVEFAEILGRPSRLVSEVVAGKRAITPETAQGIGDALGTGATFWLNLESQWQLSKLRKGSDEIGRRAEIYARFPVRDMTKRQWLPEVDSLGALESSMKRYFQLNAINDDPSFPYAAKQSDTGGTSRVVLPWLFRARALGASIASIPFDAKKLEDASSRLHRCVADPEEVRKVPAIFASAGIRFLVVEPLPGSKLDGVCFWLDADSPVIALTLRLDKLDNFWHTIFHELDHVKHGEGKDVAIVEIDISSQLNDPEISDREKRANQNAASRLIPQAELEGFIARINPLFSEDRILGFADRMQVHPSVVVGQLQHRKLLPWTAFAKFRERVRAFLTPYAFTDGYGHVAQ